MTRPVTPSLTTIAPGTSKANDVITCACGSTHLSSVLCGPESGRWTCVDCGALVAVSTPDGEDDVTALDHHDPVAPGEMPLDPGIRRYVLILRSEGIETDQSCQGAGSNDGAGHFRCDGSSHCSPEPMVRFHGNAYEGMRAFAIAMTYGLPVLAIRHAWTVYEGCLHGPQWEMTFRTADPDVTLCEPAAVLAERMAARA